MLIKILTVKAIIMSFHDGRNSATAHGLTNTLESNSCHIVGRKGKSKHYTVVFYDQSLKKKQRICVTLK